MNCKYCPSATNHEQCLRHEKTGSDHHQVLAWANRSRFCVYAPEGAYWLYEFRGSSPMVVTIGNGVVMFIRGLDESDTGFGTHPLGDRP